MDSIYTIYDKVAEECGPLFQAKSDAVACRACRNSLSNVHDVDDYKLLRVGYIDNSTGKIIVEAVPVEVDMFDVKIELVNPKSAEDKI